MEGYRSEHCILQSTFAQEKGEKAAGTWWDAQLCPGAVTRCVVPPQHGVSWRNQPGFFGAGTQMGALSVLHSPEQGERHRRDVQAAPPLFLLPCGKKAKNHCRITFGTPERPLSLLPGPSSGLYATKSKHQVWG